MHCICSAPVQGATVGSGPRTEATFMHCTCSASVHGAPGPLRLPPPVPVVTLAGRPCGGLALNLSVFARAASLLVCSNVFMTFAWYAHLRNLSAKPWYVAAIVSWGIALFEYLLQVPANRIGYRR